LVVWTKFPSYLISYMQLNPVKTFLKIPR
jgi:hypothetical protein